MKLDIVTSLELSDVVLESVYGSGGAPLGVPVGLGGGGDLGVGASASQASSEHVHSFSFTCDINTFSANIITGVLLGILNIANCNTQICANSL